MSDVNHRPLRFGILGAANIARTFIAGVTHSETVTVRAIASRSLSKAQHIARETGIGRCYGSYEELLADGDIDAIYNPLPNSLHAEWSIRALEAGKHVLCEKPLATSSKDVGAMFAAARRLGRTLVEGFPYRSQSYIQKLKQLLHAGAIGRPQMMHAAIGFTISDAANIRFNRALGGGVLLDAGTYPVSLVRLVAGECPSRVGSLARWHTSGVDQTLVASLEHPGGLLAQISCSLATAVYRQASIVGTEGSIQLSFLNSPPLDRPVVLRVARGQAWDAPVELIEILACNGFRAEAESFERLIREDSSHWTGASPEESLDIMLTLEAILESARARQTVEIVK